MRIAIVLFAGALAWAQNRPSGVVDQTIAGVANLPAERIGPHDLLAVSVYDAPELTRTVRVGADGAIRLPMLAKRIEAAGMLPGELEGAIAAELGAAEILVDPVVTVTIVEYHSRPISVMGAVKRPLTFQAAGGTTLLEALARAEGVGPEAGPELVLRAQGETRRIPLKALLDGTDPELNVALTGGEEIRIPEARRIYVVGNVKKPGAFPVRDGSETTVLKMLALAEGLSPFSGNRAYIYRAGVEVPVELDQIMRRRTPDVNLEPEDVLYIPDNKNRRMTAAVIDRVTGFGASTASGVLIWRR
jgi:polysaccharide biosynthesis/export protein